MSNPIELINHYRDADSHSSNELIPQMTKKQTSTRKKLQTLAKNKDLNKQDTINIMKQIDQLFEKNKEELVRRDTLVRYNTSRLVTIKTNRRSQNL